MTLKVLQQLSNIAQVHNASYKQFPKHIKPTAKNY